MNECLNSQEFRKALTKLMENHSKGNKFYPSFKEIFKPFDEQKLNDIQVVVVYPNATLELPEYAADNVLIIRSPLTEGEGLTHSNLWHDYINHLIDQISYRTVGTIFIFAGNETEVFSKHIRKGQYKFFVPDSTEPWDYKCLQENINDLLKKIKAEPINW